MAGTARNSASVASRNVLPMFHGNSMMSFFSSFVSHGNITLMSRLVCSRRAASSVTKMNDTHICHSISMFRPMWRPGLFPVEVFMASCSESFRMRATETHDTARPTSNKMARYQQLCRIISFESRMALLGKTK